MKTKNILRLTVLFVTGFNILTSCSLEETPFTFRQGDNYYKNATECEIAVRGAYAATQWIYSSYFFEMVEFPADYTRSNKNNDLKNPDLATYQYTPQHTSITGFYQTAYNAINRFNSVLSALNKSDFLTEKVRNSMMAEVRFLRGLHYLQLVRCFGEMPVNLDETLSSDVVSFPKWSNKAIFTEVIIQDLEFAATYLPEKPVASHRAMKASAQALLARTYLWLVSCGKNNVIYHDWVNTDGLIAEYTDSVKSKCESIMNLPQFGLYNNIADVFSVDYKVSCNGIIEHLFAVNFDFENNEGNSYCGWFSQYSAKKPGWDLTPGREPVLLGAGFNTMSPTEAFWKGINSNPLDKRDTTMFILRHGDITKKNLFVANGGSLNPADISGGVSNMTTGVNFGTIKYRKQRGLETSSKGSAQMPVIRMADVYLMYAEACGMSDPAGQEAFAKVRRRAYEKPEYILDMSSFPNEAAYIDAIIAERRIELCFEMERWFDMVRTKTIKRTYDESNITYTNKANGTTLRPKQNIKITDENQLSFFPLPSRALELNRGLEQNEPWKEANKQIQ